MNSLRNWTEEYDFMTVQLCIINKYGNLMEIVFWNTTEGSNEIKIIHFKSTLRLKIQFYHVPTIIFISGI